MSTISHLSHITSTTLNLTRNANFIPKFSTLPVNSKKSAVNNRTLSHQFMARPVFRLRATDADVEVDTKNGIEEIVTAFDVAEKETMSEVESLKRCLVDSFDNTDRGLKVSSETRAEIIELITKLEANNPTPAPTEALTMLNGKWILAFTSFLDLITLFTQGTLTLVKVKEMSQTIDSENFTVQNSVMFAGPLATTSISTNASFEVKSPKRVQIKIEEGVIGTPQLTDSLEIPENVEVLGQNIDLSPFKGLLTSVQNTASTVAKTISSQPPLKLSLSYKTTESWLLTTYLDDDLRISRGDGGSIFVLIKEGSPLSNH